MKQTFGKILCLLLFLASISQASVKVSLNSPAIYQGDTVSYTITSDGSDVEFPDLSGVAGFSVEGTSLSQSTRIINGDRTQTFSKTYILRLNKSLIIPSFVVKVDGNEVKTKETKVEVLKPTASKNGAPFVLEIKLDKNESYVGEVVDLSIIFKQKSNAHADKLQLGEPKLENFWVKKVEGNEQSSEGDYIVQKIHYKLFPQKSGEYTIPSLEALIGKVVNRQRGGNFFNDPFFSSLTRELTWKKIYSNDLKIRVNALPNGLELYGDYRIKATIDKKSVHANKPVNLTINVEGEGNVDDIKKFELDIDNVIVYADEPKISSKLIGDIYQGDFSQKVALIADRNFTIPAISLEYFDKTTKTVQTITTKPIDIEVKGGESQANATKPSTIEISPTQQTINSKPMAQNDVKIAQKSEANYIKYLFLLLGLVLGAIMMHLVNNRKSKTKESDIVKEIKKAKDDKALFNILLPHAKEHHIISNALNKLEENIYKNKNHTIDKEDLMEVFE